MGKIIKYFLDNRLVTLLVLGAVVLWGISSAPFNWEKGWLPRDPIPVDAIPDIGENQQIVYTEWPGRSPQDIEDQITYPLTTSLLGIPGVETTRSNSIFGLSSIYLIFKEDAEFYWTRTRILEKLNSLPADLLPEGVRPTLGPDATALGQVYWYTLEGRDSVGNPAGGWDLQELRTIQDFQIKYALTSVKGVSEVGSIGGFVKEYQVDVDPHAMKAYGVTISQIMQSVKKSNLDIGIRTLEYNKVEYVIRGLGFLKSLKDLEESVITSREDVPVKIKDIAHVSFGPATRRGGLDKGGVEAVGGVIVVQYGANPLQVINRVKEKIAEISVGLPSKTLSDGTVSRVTVVPFYDRTGLIKETLGTLEEALSLEMLVALLVVMVIVFNLRASLLISALLPLGVIITFIMMRQFGVGANIVSLSGIAIAIGVMVDVGIVLTENTIKHFHLPENKGKRGKALLEVAYRGTEEVASAVITAVLTTVISFLPVFAMQAKEGKLFIPLALTKTFTMIAALFVGLVFIPTLIHIVFSIRLDKSRMSKIFNGLLMLTGLIFYIGFGQDIALVLTLFGVSNLLKYYWHTYGKYANIINIIIALFVVVYFITLQWMPLGVQNTFFANLLFIVVTTGIVLGLLIPIIYYYSRMLSWCLSHKITFLAIPAIIISFGFLAWQGFDKLFGFFPEFSKNNIVWNSLEKKFPGIGKEFMPSLNEGAFLLMPTTLPHAGVGENIEIIKKVDKHLSAIPEVDVTVGKWGRVNSALDPAPISMYENIINYLPEFKVNESGYKLRFKVNEEGAFELKDGSTYEYGVDPVRSIATEDLIVDNDEGEYFRQWREEIRSPDDIWKLVIRASKFPGLTSSPKLQPIQTRLVMLSTGMRSPMGVKIFGPDLSTIEKVGYRIEDLLKQVRGIDPSTVFADRGVSKPYMEIRPDRRTIARYGLTIADIQAALSVGIGGMKLTNTVEGRNRFPVRVRYAREYRDNPEDLKRILIPTPSGAQITLGQLADIVYTKGPQVIKAENTFLTSYVIFDKEKGYADVDVVEQAQQLLNDNIQSGELTLPAGVSYRFAGSYEDQIRATKRLMILVPVSLLIIFLILYFQFRSLVTISLIFSGLAIAFSGGFILLWLYNQSGFLNFSIAGINLRGLFNIHTVNLSVAIWVGFIALFGVATDNGVLMGTYLDQLFKKDHPTTVATVRDAVLIAADKRVRPAILTTATTIIALIPVLTSRGKGSDIMEPMAIPLFGGMLVAVITLFTVPVLYSLWKENQLKSSSS